MESIKLLYCIVLLQFWCSRRIGYISCNAQSLPKVPAVFFFGDSSVDTGNNDYLNTKTRADHAPYGVIFPGHVATGRFSDGKLISDLLVSALGLKDTLPPFLNPDLSNDDLLTGVCFASSGAGFDEQTNANKNETTMLKQIPYLASYLERLKLIAGNEEAERIVNGAMVTVSAGSVDFFRNFYVEQSSRSLQFTISQYQDFLLNNMQTFLKGIYDLGLRNIAVTGLPPLGCFPIVLTAKLRLLRTCVDHINSDAVIYNQKLKNLLASLEANLPGSKIRYADSYNILLDMIKNKANYGFVETGRGCCGTGLIETLSLCDPSTPICSNTSQYLFFDSIHPCESACRYIVQQQLKQLIPQFL